MGPGIDHVVFGEVAKVGKDKLGEVSLPNTNLGGTLQRAGLEKPEAKIESRRPLQQSAVQYPTGRERWTCPVCWRT